MTRKNYPHFIILYLKRQQKNRFFPESGCLFKKFIRNNIFESTSASIFATFFFFRHLKSMEVKNTYSDAGFQLKLITDYKRNLEGKMDSCKNMESALEIRDTLLSELSKNCQSSIIKKHLFEMSENIIRGKFQNERNNKRNSH